MEKLMKKLLSAASKNPVALKELKGAAVRCQQYELAAGLRQLELDNYPQTQAQKTAERSAQKTDVFLRMIGMQLDQPSYTWLLKEAFKIYLQKEGDFDVSDASKLKVAQRKLFPNETHKL